MKLSDFNYFLPKELIAQEPVALRDRSRLMVLHRDRKLIEHRIFRDVVEYLKEGDALVINDTKVIPARLIGRKRDRTALVEVLLLKRRDETCWEVLVRPGDKVRVGEEIIFGQGELKGKVLERRDTGGRLVEFVYEGNFDEILNVLGQVPLPPYIKRGPESEAELRKRDRERYQTIYAKHEGSVAAPTAGLHFTRELLNSLEAKGIKIISITLHLGLGTFRPVRREDYREHRLEEEWYRVNPEEAELLNKIRDKGKRIIAVGTSVTRTLETVAGSGGRIKPGEGFTSLFIYPGYQFRVVDSLITNFHLPKSTLIMLVCAFGGTEFVLKAYQEAIRLRYRFYSYGDAMLIL